MDTRQSKTRDDSSKANANQTNPAGANKSLLTPPPFSLTADVQKKPDDGVDQSPQQSNQRPLVTDLQTKEAEYNTRGDAAYTALKASYNLKVDFADNIKTGHSEAKLEGMPPWFDKLQSIMARNPRWTIQSERASWLLKEYALWHFQTKLGMPELPANVQVFFNYLGMGNMGEKSGASNKQAYQAFYKKIDSEIAALEAQLNLPSIPDEQKEKIKQDIADFKRAKDNPHDVADLGASGGMWCNAATTQALKKSFAGTSAKLSDWDMQSPAYTGKDSVVADNKDAYELKGAEAGDIIIIIGSQTPPTGHVMTFIRQEGDKIMAVSGNAGFASVRIDSTTREMPPDGYSRWNVKKIDDEYTALKKEHPDIDKEIADAKEAYAKITVSVPSTNPNISTSSISTAEAIKMQIAGLEAKKIRKLALEDKIPGSTNRSIAISGRSLNASERWFPDPGKIWVVAIIKTSRIDAHKVNPEDYEKLHLLGKGRK